MHFNIFKIFLASQLRAEDWLLRIFRIFKIVMLSILIFNFIKYYLDYSQRYLVDYYYMSVARNLTHHLVLSPQIISPLSHSLLLLLDTDLPARLPFSYRKLWEAEEAWEFCCFIRFLRSLALATNSWAALSWFNYINLSRILSAKNASSPPSV